MLLSELYDVLQLGENNNTNTAHDAVRTDYLVEYMTPAGWHEDSSWSIQHHAYLRTDTCKAVLCLATRLILGPAFNTGVVSHDAPTH